MIKKYDFERLSCDFADIKRSPDSILINNLLKLDPGTHLKAAFITIMR